MNKIFVSLGVLLTVAQSSSVTVTLATSSRLSFDFTLVFGPQ